MNNSNKKLTFSNRILIFTLISINLINIYSYFFHFNEYIKFFKIYISVDGIISEPKIVFIKVVIFLIFILLIVLFLIYNHSHFDNKKIMFIKHYQSFNKVEKIAFIFIFILLIPSIIQFINDNGIKYGQIQLPRIIFDEDGFFECLTALFALIASFIILISLMIKKGKFEIFVKIFLSLFFFLFAMEELSWGQRIFEWETPSILKEINYQNETNIHNFFNPYLHIFYPLFNLTIALSIYLSINYKNFIINYFKFEKHTYLLFTKNYKFYVYTFLMLAMGSLFYSTFFMNAISPFAELTELIFSIFILVYSLNQLIISKSKMIH